MTLRLFWSILLIPALGLLVYSVVVYRAFRRRGAVLPYYMAGNLTGGVSIVLLIIANLLDLNSSAGIATLIGSALLLVWSIGVSLRARRHRA